MVLHLMLITPHLPYAEILRATYAKTINYYRQNESLQPWSLPWAPVTVENSPWSKLPPYAIGEKAGIQHRMTTVIESYPKMNCKLVMIDTHAVVSLPPGIFALHRLLLLLSPTALVGRKPDIIIVPKCYAPTNLAPTSKKHPIPSAYYIAALGEVKKHESRPNGFTDEEVGEVESFLQCLLHAQPYRSEAVAFLTDTINIQFVKLERGAVNFMLHLSKSYALVTTKGKPGNGAHLLHGLLNTDAAQLGAQIEDIQIRTLPCKITIETHLGFGAVSSVWRGKYGNEEVVVKLYRPHNTNSINIEQENLVNLAKVHELNGLVPRLLGMDVNRRALVLSPVCKPFGNDLSDYCWGKAMPEPGHICQLVAILKLVHEKARLVHRDLAPRNFFVHPQTGNVRSLLY